MRVGHSQLFGAIVIAVVVILLASQIRLSVQNTEHLKSQENAHKQLSQVASALSLSLNIRLNLTKSLRTFVAVKSDFSQQEFDLFATLLQEDMKGIRSLQLAPDGIVRYLTNIENNKSVLGHNLLTEGRYKELVKQSIRDHTHTIHGPFELRQGGLGIVARNPVYLTRPGDDEESFWGFSTIVIETKPLLEDAGVFTLEDDWIIAIRGKDALGSKGDVFYGDASVFDSPLSVVDVNLIYGSWQIAAIKKPGITPDIFVLSGWFLVFTILLATFLSLLMYFIINQPRLLRRQISEATEKQGKTLLSLQESELRYRNLFDNSEVSIWNEDMSVIYETLENLREEGITDIVQYLEKHPELVWELAASVKVLHVNKATLKLFETKSERELTYKIDETFGPGAIEVFTTGLYAVWNKEPFFRETANFRSLKGKDIQAIIYYGIPKAAEGFKSIPVSIFDVTELKRVEDALRESAARFGQLFEHTDSISVKGYGRDRKVIYWNGASEKLYGYSREDAIGQKLEDLIIPDDMRDYVVDAVTCWIDGGPAIPSSELMLRKADGQLVHVFSNHVLFHNQNNEIELYCIDIDLSKLRQTEEALRESEEKYRSLYDNAPLSYQSLGEDDCLVDVNPTWLTTLGYEREEVIGQWFGGFLNEEGKEHFKKNFSLFKQSGCVYDVKFKIRHKQGHYLDISFNGCIGYTPEGRFKQTYCVFIDITDRVLAEQEKERMQRELDQARKMDALGQLTGGIAHDFNNILGVVMGYTSMALDRFGDEIPDKLVHYLNTTMKASERARDLVAQMMLFSRTSSDVDDTHVMQLAPSLKETVKMLQSVLPSSIKLELDFEEDIPCIHMSPNKLQQMLMNLCLNAKDAMDGVGTLSIKLSSHHNIDEECSACHQKIKGDWVMLQVADTGCGMTSETVEHIFEPFFTTKNIGEGTGMGLSVSHGIMSDYGGHILVETVVDVGTSISLMLPPVSDGEETVEKSESQQEELPKGTGNHLLVVDDEPELAKYIGTLLKMHDYKVTIELDSQHALELFKETPDEYSLLITDQTMPGLTGVELIKKIREVRADLPVILCSGYSESLDQLNTEAMAINFLEKPFDSATFIQLVSESLSDSEKS